MSSEARTSFACFGGTVTVHVGGDAAVSAEEAASDARTRLLDANRRFSRFLPESELSHLNLDRRFTVPVSRPMLELAAAARRAGFLSGGLVDATMLDDIERAGYRESRAEGLELPMAAGAPAGTHRRKPAAASPRRGWSLIAVDRRAGTVSRPSGLRIDSGGIAKGLLADAVAATLGRHSTYAVDCCGDIRIGGAGRRPRAVFVASPDSGGPLHTLAIEDGAVATSGIAKRSWIGPDRSACLE